MPALITHHLFGEESIDRLPAGLVQSDEERAAFLLANQGPDPFFFRFRTPNLKPCMKLAHEMHNQLIAKQYRALREGVSRLPKQDAATGRAFALGLLSHYALDRNAHPFVYAQQWGIQEADAELEKSGDAVHAVIESDLDVLMLQLKRDHATTAEYPPAEELVSSERIDRIAGALMSHVANTVYGLPVGVTEYGGAVADMQLVYRLIEPMGSVGEHAVALLEPLATHAHSFIAALAHPVTAEPPARTGNLGNLTWENPFTHTLSSESFPEVFDRALADYEQMAAKFIAGVDMAEVTRHLNYSGRPLEASERFDGTE